MSTYLVKLTPQEPYFFGNEKNLEFKGEKNRGQMTNRYYIKSERTPLQTTLLGAMRYVFLKNKTYDLSGENVGGESFKIEKDNQDFGVIKKISPLFLLKGDERLVVTPFDHIKGKKIYTPFSNYTEITTAENKKWYTPDFDVKEGITDSYVYVDGENTGKIVDSDKIFSCTTRVMINKNQDKKAFFKKDYVTLAKGYSFGFYLDLSDNSDDISKVTEQDHILYLGQGKSLFLVQFVKAENGNDIESKIKSLIGENKAYCFGDTLADNSIYQSVKFAVVDFRDYRAYATKPDGKVEKGGELYKLIRSGSVFVSNDISKVVCKRENCEKIGFNIIVK